ncbi:hypothetical protein MRB53_009852 [Persea americana]|uniref:Uncharacterized protein n=1 Tax=Persea americana TaxID=3435 RepID=A0ACC2LQI9_PERAE|nr:hypothetical protein MRB53_009852 [Persea americana]
MFDEHPDDEYDPPACNKEVKGDEEVGVGDILTFHMCTNDENLDVYSNAIFLCKVLEAKMKEGFWYIGKGIED